MTTLQIVGGMPILYIAVYFALKSFIPAWSHVDRGFQPLENKWKKAFLNAGIFATVVGVALDLLSSASTVTAFSLAAVSGLLLIAAYSDLLVGKVPLELSHATLWTGVFLGLGTLTINSFQMEDFQRFYSVIPLIFNGNEWLWIGGGLVTCLVFFLVWFRVKSLLNLVFILISMIGLWVAVSAALNLVTVGLTNMVGLDVEWRNIFVYGIPSMLIVVLFTVAFDLGAGKYMGGADAQSMYAVGWGFAGIVGGVTIGLGVIIASFAQLLLHAFRKPLHIPGKPLVLKNQGITKAVGKLWYVITFRPSKQVAETRVAYQLPFLPVLNTAVIFTTLFTVALY